MYVNMGACQSPYLLGTDICTLDTVSFHWRKNSTLYTMWVKEAFQWHYNINYSTECSLNTIITNHNSQKTVIYDLLCIKTFTLLDTFRQSCTSHMEHHPYIRTLQWWTWHMSVNNSEIKESGYATDHLCHYFLKCNLPDCGRTNSQVWIS
jgi:hypothetical protein